MSKTSSRAAFPLGLFGSKVLFSIEAKSLALSTLFPTAVTPALRLGKKLDIAAARPGCSLEERAIAI